MRENRTVQSSIFEIYAEHEIGKEMKGISDWLDENLEQAKAYQGDGRCSIPKEVRFESRRHGEK